MLPAPLVSERLLYLGAVFEAKVDVAANVVSHRVKLSLMPDVGEAFVFGFFLGLFLRFRTAEQIDKKHAVAFQRSMGPFEICAKLVARIENEI